MNQPWLPHYDPGVPQRIENYPEQTLVEFVADHASRRPDAVAVVFKGRRFTFRELDLWSDALAQSLKRRGIHRGDRVAVVLPNCPQFLISELAIWKLGAIIAPQNPIYTPRELQESLATTTPKIVITLTPFYNTVKESHDGLVVATNIKEYLSPVLRVLFTLVKEKKEGHRIELREGDVWLGDLISKGESLGNPGSIARPDDPAVILMSGGTTGTPKGVLSRHRDLVTAGTQLGEWLRDALKGPDASIMLPLPLFHTYGFAGAQSITITKGIPLMLIPNPRDVGDVVASIDRDRPALFCGVPTLFNALLNNKKVISGKANFRSVKACFSGAAPLMAETKKRFEEVTGGRIVEGYSLTEATMAVCANPLGGTNKIGSIGMPLPDVIVKIVDPDDASREVAAKEVGEILIQAPQIMQGYWNNPGETAETVIDGWLHTGDLGYMDEEGFIFIVDRKKDLIKTSGFQVWPREIEEVLSSHPSVAEAGAAGLPDPYKGEVVVAWVVPRPGQTVDPEDLRTWCRQKLAPFKVPARIELRTELPKTMVGKVLRRKLVAEAKQKMAQ